MPISKERNTSRKVSEYAVNIEDAKISVLTEYVDESYASDEPISSMKIPHAHSGYELFYSGKGGTMKFEVESETVTIGSCEMIIISPKVNHRLLSSYGNSEKFNGKYDANKALIFSIVSNGIETAFPFCNSISNALCQSYTHISNLSHTGEYLYNIEQLLMNPNYSKLHYNVYMLFNAILDKLKYTNSDTGLCPDPGKIDSDMSRIHRIYSYIEANLRSSIALEDVASFLNLSTRQTGRIIKEFYGLTWRDFIAQKRIEQAKMHMIEDNLTLNEIIARVGFQSSKGFYKAFKKFTGYTPVKFRKMFEKNKN